MFDETPERDLEREIRITSCEFVREDVREALGMGAAGAFRTRHPFRMAAGAP